MAARARTRRLVAGALLACLLLAAVARGAWFALCAYYFNALTPKVLPPLEPVRGLGSPRASGCAACHGAIAEEWRRSLHGQAMSDRFFVAEYASEGRIFACLRCHAPLWEQQPTEVTGFADLGPPRPRQRPNARFDRALHDEGVTCVVCHQRGDALVGPLPLDPGAVPHAVTVDPSFGANALCARCHAAEGFPGAEFQRAILPTFEEHREYRARGGRMRCVECHFPAEERPLTAGTPPRAGRSHRLLGPRDRAFLQAHLALDPPRCAALGARLSCVLGLTNGAGHRLPTAEPGRELALSLEPKGGGPGGSAHILRRVDRAALTERPDQDNTLRPGEHRFVEVTAPSGPATLSVRFCLYEERDPVLALARVPYREVCHTLAAWDVTATGAASPRELGDSSLR
ncbi:MAG: hypothetical protein HY909_16895 [Deltaproteobacteria bacterium]|nr:hypothetical protein [Deltaproteobacteria bacterium]